MLASKYIAYRHRETLMCNNDSYNCNLFIFQLSKIRKKDKIILSIDYDLFIIF